jgi:hypothetical protein
MKNNLLFAIYVGKFPFKDTENADRKTQTHKRRQKDGSNTNCSLLTDMQVYVHLYSVHTIIQFSNY